MRLTLFLVCNEKKYAEIANQPTQRMVVCVGAGRLACEKDRQKESERERKKSAIRTQFLQVDSKRP